MVLITVVGTVRSSHCSTCGRNRRRSLPRRLILDSNPNHLRQTKRVMGFNLNGNMGRPTRERHSFAGWLRRCDTAQAPLPGEGAVSQVSVYGADGRYIVVSATF